MTLISIVSPCYNEEDNIRECYRVVRELFTEGGPLERYEYEHVFADNASTDSSLEILEELAAEDSNIKVVANARNYGPFRSTFNALRYASGDAIVPMFPVDLQDPPELIPKFIEHWEAGKLRVYGVRATRSETFMLRNVRKLYYWAVNRFSNVKIPQNVAEFQVIDRQVLDAILQYRDYYPYIRGMIANVGFERDSIAVEYNWNERARGFSKNNFLNLIDQGLNGIISFSNFPMRFCIFLGTTIAMLSIFYGVYQLVYNLAVNGAAPPGVPTLIVALFMFSGAQLAMLGVLGEYIAAIHFQVRQGDTLIERKLINLSESRSGSKSLNRDC